MEASIARVMVIEDAPDLMRLTAHILQSAGFRVVQAYGGEDALRKVKLHKPDLIVTDLAMPKMSGVEVIDKIKHDPETAHIPCIAATAFMWDQIASAASQAGCDGFVAKPFDALRLLHEVSKFVAMPPKPGARTPPAAQS